MPQAQPFSSVFTVNLHIYHDTFFWNLFLLTTWWYVAYSPISWECRGWWHQCNSVHSDYAQTFGVSWKHYLISMFTSRWKVGWFNCLKRENGETIPDQSFPTLCSSNLFVRKKLTNLPRSKSFHSLDCDAHFEKTFEFWFVHSHLKGVKIKNRFTELALSAWYTIYMY